MTLSDKPSSIIAQNIKTKRHRDIEREYDVFNQLDHFSQRAIWNGVHHRLQLRSFNSDILVTLLTLRVRMLFLNGTIEDISFYQSPTADRAENLSTFDVGVGWILSVMVHAEPAEPRRGTTYVIVRTFDNKAQAHTAELIAAYVSGGHHSAWPDGIQEGPTDGNGAMITFDSFNPVAGAQWSAEVPTNARWRIVTVRARFVTDATVINRRLHVNLGDIDTDYVDCPRAGDHPASTTRDYNMAHWGSTPAESDGEDYVNIPDTIFLRAGDFIFSRTTNMQPADDWFGVTIVAEEWIEI